MVGEKKRWKLSPQRDPPTPPFSLPLPFSPSVKPATWPAPWLSDCAQLAMRELNAPNPSTPLSTPPPRTPKLPPEKKGVVPPTSTHMHITNAHTQKHQPWKEPHTSTPFVLASPPNHWLTDSLLLLRLHPPPSLPHHPSSLSTLPSFCLPLRCPSLHHFLPPLSVLLPPPKVVGKPH